MDNNSAYMLAHTLAAHAQVVSDAALLNAKVASMIAWNNQSPEDQPYTKEEFDRAIHEASSLGYNTVAESFRY